MNSNKGEKKESKSSSESEEKPVNPDVGIFGATNGKIVANEHSLEGFCATYNDARSTNGSDDLDGEVALNEELDGAVDDSPVDPPISKKQRTTKASSPSPLIQSNADVLGLVYSFLTLKEAVVLRRTCHQLNTDSTIFRCSLIVDRSLVTRLVRYKSTQDKYLEKQDLAMCNIGNASHFRALLSNKTLPKAKIEDFMENLIEKSSLDNGQAVSILVQDERCRVEADMLDKMLRKDFTAMSAALQQDPVVRAGIRMCVTCSINIGCYECFKGSKCKSVAVVNKSAAGASVAASDEKDDLPKYCRTCALANDIFCSCGELLCSKCQDAAVPRVDKCHCGTIVCRRGECVFPVCHGCGDRFDACKDCAKDEAYYPECYACYHESRYDEYDYYNTRHSDYYGDSDCY